MVEWPLHMHMLLLLDHTNDGLGETGAWQNNGMLGFTTIAMIRLRPVALNHT